MREIARRLVNNVWRTVDVDEAANGGSQPFELLGPFTIDFNTPGFINPNDNGIPTLAIPAGMLVLSIVPVTTATFTGGNDSDYMFVVLATSGSGSGPTVGAYSLASADNPTIALGAALVASALITSGDAEAMSFAYQQRPAQAVDDCHLIAGYFPAGSVTAGSLDLYAVVATPS